MFCVLDRHIFKELSVSFLIGVFTLTLVLLVHQLLRLLEFVIDRGVGFVTVGRLFLSLLPAFFLLTIPMAVMLASVATFNRLASDNEITALRTAGIGFYRMARPVLLFSSSAALFTFWMGILAEPWSGTSLKSLSGDLLKKMSGLGLTEGEINEAGDGLMVYVEAMPTPSTMRGIFIHDQRKPGPPMIIVAKSGAITYRPETGTVTFALADGSMYRRGKTVSDYQKMTFSDYLFESHPFSYPLDTTVREITTSELKKEIARTQGGNPETLRLLTQFYRKYAFPAAALFFGILGAPLGMSVGRAGRLSGLALGMGVILLYYALSMAGDYLVVRRWTTPLIAAWFPNLVLIPLSLTLFLLRKQIRGMHRN